MINARQVRRLIVASIAALAIGFLPASPAGIGVAQAAKITSQKPPRPKPAEIAARATKSGLMLRATMGNGGPMLDGNLVWTITPVPAEASVAAIEMTGPAPFVALEPSRYTITVRADDASTTGVADVVAGPAADFTLSLDAGRLAMQVLPGQGAMPVLRANLRVLKAGADKPIASFAANGKDIVRVLPTGKYTLETRAGTFKRLEEIIISPGSTTRLVLDLNIGYLRARAVATQGGEALAGAVFTIQPETVAAGAELPATAMNGPAPVFVLAAGRYRLIAQFGAAKSERIVVINSNEFADVTLNLMAGRIDVKAINLTSQVSRQVDFVVSRRGEGDPETIARYRGAPAKMRLPQGDYEIVASLADARTTMRASLQPGEIKVVEFSLDQSSFARITAAIASLASAVTSEKSIEGGFATLRLLDEQSAGIEGNIVWVISTDDGVEIGRFRQTTPTAVLSPGRYLATANFQGQTYQAAFIVETGRTTPVDLTAK